MLFLFSIFRSDIKIIKEIETKITMTKIVEIKIPDNLLQFLYCNTVLVLVLSMVCVRAKKNPTSLRLKSVSGGRAVEGPSSRPIIGRLGGGATFTAGAA